MPRAPQIGQEPRSEASLNVTKPTIVAEAYARARAASFTLSCEPEVGALLSVLAAAVPAGGRILELGTGVGTGLAWLVHGLGERSDAELLSIDLDADIQESARQGAWPPWVRFLEGDAAELLPTLGAFDLVFADAPGGKLFGLGHTLDALAPRGVLIVDDMDLGRHTDPELKAALVSVRERLLERPDLLVAEFDIGSGVMLAVRRA